MGLVAGALERLVLAPAPRWSGGDRRAGGARRRPGSPRAQAARPPRHLRDSSPAGVAGGRGAAGGARGARPLLVLGARGYGGAHEVGRQPAEEQRAVVAAILRRELGLMTLA